MFADGALFFLGDGHALQGDGEMDGTGVEISMDVRFSLDLIKGKTIGWPRAEDETFLMTCGNVRPLDQAVQHATTEMVSWLETDYGLTTREAHMLLGRFVEYDVGNMYDPALLHGVQGFGKSVSGRVGSARTGRRATDWAMPDRATQGISVSSTVRFSLAGDVAGDYGSEGFERRRAVLRDGGRPRARPERRHFGA